MDIMMRLKGAGFSVIANEFRQREKRLGTGLPLQDFIEIVLQGLPMAANEQEKFANVNALVDLFDAIDINGDGTMEFDEFTSFCVDAGMVATRNPSANLKHRYVRNAKHVIKTMNGSMGIEKVRWSASFQKFLVVENGAKSVKLFNVDGVLVADVLAQSALLNGPLSVGSGGEAGSPLPPRHSSSENAQRFSIDGEDSGPDSGGFATGSSAPTRRTRASDTSRASGSGAGGSASVAAAAANNTGIFILDATFLFKFQCLAISTTDFVISFYNMEEPKHHKQRPQTLSSSSTASSSGPSYDLLPKLTITTTNAQLVLRFCEQNGLLLSAGNDCIINVWKIIDLENKILWKRLLHHQDMVTDIVEIPMHDLIASCDLHHTIQLWDAHDCRSRGALVGHTRGIKQMVFSKDHDLLLTAGFEFDAYGWDLASRQVVLKLVGHRAPLIGVQLALFQSERAITADSSGVFKVWDISRATGGGGGHGSTQASSSGGGGGGGNGGGGGGRSASHAVVLESLDPSQQLSRFEPTTFVCLHPHRRDLWAAASGSATLHLFRSARVQLFGEIPLKAFYHYNANKFVVVSGPVCSIWEGVTGACVDEFTHVGASSSSGRHSSSSASCSANGSSSHNGAATTPGLEPSTDILLCVQDANCKKLVVLSEDGAMGVFNCQNFVQMRRCEERFQRAKTTTSSRSSGSTKSKKGTVGGIGGALSCGVVGLHYCSENKLVIATDAHTRSIVVIDDNNNSNNSNSSDLSTKGATESTVLRRLVHLPGGISASAYGYHASLIATLDEQTCRVVSLWDFETLSFVAQCELEQEQEQEEDEEAEKGESDKLSVLEFWDEFPVLFAADLDGSVYLYAVMPTKYANTGKLLHAFANDPALAVEADIDIDSRGIGPAPTSTSRPSSAADVNQAESSGCATLSSPAADAEATATFLTEATESAARKFLVKKRQSTRKEAAAPQSRPVSGSSRTTNQQQRRPKRPRGSAVTCMKVVFDDGEGDCEGEGGHSNHKTRYLLFTGDEKGIVRVWDLSQMMRRLALFKIPEASCKYLKRGYHPRAMFARDCVKEAMKRSSNNSTTSGRDTKPSQQRGSVVAAEGTTTGSDPNDAPLKKLAKLRADRSSKSIKASSALVKLLSGNRLQHDHAPPAGSSVAAAEAFLLSSSFSSKSQKVIHHSKSTKMMQASKANLLEGDTSSGGGGTLIRNVPSRGTTNGDALFAGSFWMWNWSIPGPPIATHSRA